MLKSLYNLQLTHSTHGKQYFGSGIKNTTKTMKLNSSNNNNQNNNGNSQGCGSSWIFCRFYRFRFRTSASNVTMATKKWRIFRTTFAIVNLFNLGFFCLSHESVSNLLFTSERFIQIDEWSEEQQPYY